MIEDTLYMNLTDHPRGACLCEFCYKNKTHKIYRIYDEIEIKNHSAWDKTFSLYFVCDECEQNKEIIKTILSLKKL